MCAWTLKASIVSYIRKSVSQRAAYAFMAMVFLAPFAVLASTHAANGDLGVIGPVYPIKEQDLIEYIKNKLAAMQKSGELKTLQQQQLERAKKTINRPKPTSGITRTVKAHTFYIDPSITTDHNITDHKGRIIVMAGTKVNPFDYINMSKDLIFINGDDPDQVRWAKRMGARYHGRIKPILVNGSPIDLMKKWKRRVYFDQRGTLTKRFHIKHVPAIVSQAKKMLRIDEVAP